MVSGILGHFSGTLRHHHLSLPVFLASVARGRGRTQGRRIDYRSAARRDRRGVTEIPHRHHYRNVFLEPDYVFHHPDDGGDAARSRQDHHFDRAGCGRGAAPSRGKRRLLVVQSGIDWRGHAGRAGARGIERLRGGRGGGVGGVASGSSRSRARILWRDRGGFSAGTGPELRRFQCGFHAVLGGGFERRVSAATHHHRAAADQQSGDYGRAFEPTAASRPASPNTSAPST